MPLVATPGFPLTSQPKYLSSTCKLLPGDLGKPAMERPYLRRLRVFKLQIIKTYGQHKDDFCFFYCLYKQTFKKEASTDSAILSPRCPPLLYQSIIQPRMIFHTAVCHTQPNEPASHVLLPELLVSSHLPSQNLILAPSLATSKDPDTTHPAEDLA